MHKTPSRFSFLLVPLFCSLFIFLYTLNLSAGEKTNLSFDPLNAKEYRYYRELEYFSILASRDLTEKTISEVDRHLRNARREIGQALNFFPENKIVVIFYSTDRFRADVTNSPFVHGLYDGKIHIPVPDTLTDQKLSSIIHHEYTHALIYQLCKNRCPLWLNEGLAEYFQSQILPVDFQFLNQENLNSKSKTLSNPIDLEHLEKAFKEPLNAQYADLKLAGEQSYQLVKSIVSRYSWAHFHTLLLNLKNRLGFEEAFLAAFSIPFSRFLSTWHNNGT